VHVEGERRRGIALSKLLRHEAVGFVVSSEPTVAFGYAQAEEPLGAEIGIVIERKGRVAVVAVGARGEALVLRFSHLIQLICPKITRPAVSSRSKVKHLTDSEH
jgi:hypothetical protein